jgi:hypothetical protein
MLGLKLSLVDPLCNGLEWLELFQILISEQSILLKAFLGSKEGTRGKYDRLLLLLRGSGYEWRLEVMLGALVTLLGLIHCQASFENISCCSLILAFCN